jgi:hypothetical protein
MRRENDIEPYLVQLRALPFVERAKVVRDEDEAHVVRVSGKAARRE